LLRNLRRPSVAIFCSSVIKKLTVFSSILFFI
jgi:hypothetical protein